MQKNRDIFQTILKWHRSFASPCVARPMVSEIRSILRLNFHIGLLGLKGQRLRSLSK